MAESQPAGVRLVFRSRATEVELDAHRVVTNYQGVPPRPDCFYDLCVDGELAAQMSITGGDEVVLDFSGGAETRPGPTGTVRFAGLPDRDKLVELWLPWSETTHLVELRTNAPVLPATGDRRVWLHHGSSISQGSVADSPSTTWPAIAAQRGGVELVNLGLAGQRAARPVHRPHHAGHPGGPGQRQDRHQPGEPRPDAAPRVRPGGARLPRHDPRRPPDVPLLVVSPLLCPIHEETPGPGTFDVEALGDGEVRFRRDRRPGRRGGRQAHAAGDPRGAHPDRGPACPGRPRDPLPRRARRCTARRTTTTCRCPTPCTRTARRTGSSGPVRRRGVRSWPPVRRRVTEKWL